MAKRLALRWTRQAANDLTEAFEYVASDSPSAASRLVDRIERTIELLRELPHAGRASQRPGVREILVPGSPYRVIYRVKNEAIEILSVFHSSRQRPEN